MYTVFNAKQSNRNMAGFNVAMSPDNSFINDHVIHGHCIFPAVMYLDSVIAMYEARYGSEPESMRDVVWISPLIMKGPCRELRVSFIEKQNATRFMITSEEGTKRMIHAQGRIIADGCGNPGRPAVLRTDHYIRNCRRHVAGDDCYRMFEHAGISYGPSLRSIRELYVSNNEVLSLITAPADGARGGSYNSLHPSLMDGALQSIIGFFVNEGGDGATVYIPFSAGGIRFIRPLPDTCYVHIRRLPASVHDASSRSFDIAIVNPAGEYVVQLNNVTFRAINSNLKKGG